MRIATAAALAASGVALLVPPMQAHHSTSAMFDTHTTITISGRITQTDWINPHASFSVDAKESGGTGALWELQLPSPVALMKEGITRDQLKSGDRVSITAWPAKDRATLAYPLTVTFPDGRVLNIPRVWMGRG